MYACISHALSAEVDQYCGVEATMSDGPEDLGYVVYDPLYCEKFTDCALAHSHRREKDWKCTCTAGVVVMPGLCGMTSYPS
jgi:hypothetical protein